MTSGNLTQTEASHGLQPSALAPVVDVVIPVYNEETDLEPCVRRLHAHLTAGLPYPFQITVTDNASTSIGATAFPSRADE